MVELLSDLVGIRDWVFVVFDVVLDASMAATEELLQNVKELIGRL
jgi:hypothetical protein